MGKPRNIPEITEEHLKQIRALSGYGLSMNQISNVIGLARSSFYEYMARDPRIKEALENGRSMARAVIGKSLFEQAKEGNVRAIQYYESTRFGIRMDNPIALDEEDTEMDFTQLEDDDLLKLEELVEKAQVKDDYYDLGGEKENEIEDAEFEEINEEPTE